MKPDKLYHGSSRKIDGPLKPVLKQDSPDHIHTRASVFGTQRPDLAGLFMFPFDTLASIGFEKDIAYICIWGTAEEFTPKDTGGYLYILPSDSFEKIGKEYEWQSFMEVLPLETKYFPSVIDGMIELGIQVYFINDNDVFDRVVKEKDNRSPLLSELISENQKRGINVKTFN